MKKKLFILDVSGFIFRAYYALPPMSNSKGEVTHALFGFIRSVIKLFKDFNPDHVVAVFDGPDNKKQRREIYEKYKANRTRLHEDLPHQIERAKEFCALSGIPEVEVSGVEADDAIGSVAMRGLEKGYEVFICTSDKDFCQLVQQDISLVNPWKENLIIDRNKVKEIYGVFPEQIIDLLSLMGDASDNIPGVKGIGPKTAISLLSEFGTLEALLENLDNVSGKKKELLLQDSESAKVSKKLATIHTDISFSIDKTFYTIAPTDFYALKEFYIEMGFHSLVSELEEHLKEELPKEKVHYHLVEDEKALFSLVEELKRNQEISFDTEATSLKVMIAKLVGIGFCMGAKKAYYIPLNGKLDPHKVIGALKTLFENPTLKFYGHNVKYDLHILENSGIRCINLCFDTMLASYLLNSNSRRHSLDMLALHYIGKVMTPIKSLIGTGRQEISIDKVEIEKVSDYCCEDVDYTFRLKEILKNEIETRKLSYLLDEIELPLTRVLFKMERVGMYVDVALLSDFAKEISIEIKQLEEEIYDLAGEKFNLNSPKQLSAILFEKLQIKPLKKTATGLSTRADVLESLARDYPIADKILTYRGLEKLRSTYLEALPQEVNPQTGRIHPTFNQFVTATGRLACQDPNLQNIPVRSELGKKIREAFKPQKEKWSFLAADYSQIELRLLAHFSEDPDLMKAFHKGEDIHAFTASVIFDTSLEKVTSRQREQAKAINFGIIYGQQAFGLSQALGIGVKEAAQFIEAYFAKYPKVLSFIKSCVESAKKEGKSRTMTGRERDIPDIQSSNVIARNAAERLAINTPLQGSSADLIKLAMLEIDHILSREKLEAFMILQVHDELIFEVPDSEISILEPFVKEAMETVISLKVPLVVDVKVGKNWARC